MSDCRLQSHLLSNMRKSPSSSFESNHFSRSISFKDDYDVEDICDERCDSLLPSSTTITANGVMTTVAAATVTAHDSAIGNKLHCTDIVL